MRRSPTGIEEKAQRACAIELRSQNEQMKGVDHRVESNEIRVHRLDGLGLWVRAGIITQ